MLDTRVVGGTVVSATGSSRLDVGVAGGRFVGLYAAGWAPEARETVQAAGLLVLPGVVDAHFHCRAPGHPEREDFDSGTQAAAAGGVTTICEMPTAVPAVRDAATFRDRRAFASRQAHVDFALWAGGGAHSAADIQGMAAEGAIGYKLFLHAAPPGREVEYAGVTATDTASLYQSLAWIQPTGLPLAIHCEDDALIHARTEQLRARGEVGPRAHAASRPPFVEAVAVSTVLILAEEVGTRVHFPHVSTAHGLELVAAAKRRGRPVSVETCPHYLLFEADVADRAGPFAKINPPIRSAADRQALWSGIRDRTVDVVASDHAPYTLEEKEAGWQDVFRAPSGCPGAELMAPALLDRALRGELSLERVVELVSERPATLFGLGRRKGAVQPGRDADLVLFDPAGSWLVRTDRLLSRSGGSARLYEGMALRGRVVATYVRGRPAYQDGAIVNDLGAGEFVRPA